MAVGGCSKETLELFLYWLDHSKHHEDLEYQRRDDYVGCTIEKRRKDQEIQLKMAILWDFGEAYDIPRLQNDTMRLIHRRMTGIPTTPDLLRLFTSGQLRQDTDLWEVIVDEMTHEFMKEVPILSDTEMSECTSLPGIAFAVKDRFRDFCDHMRHYPAATAQSVEK
jgi:hypothetical protein